MFWIFKSMRKADKELGSLSIIYCPSLLFPFHILPILPLIWNGNNKLGICPGKIWTGHKYWCPQYKKHSYYVPQAAWTVPMCYHTLPCTLTSLLLACMMPPCLTPCCQCVPLRLPWMHISCNFWSVTWTAITKISIFTVLLGPVSNWGNKWYIMTQVLWWSLARVWVLLTVSKLSLVILNMSATERATGELWRICKNNCICKTISK